MNRKPLIVVLGPTATGKSDLAVAIAKKFNGEVISADSRQVYKGLDIGTGKITEKEMVGIPHHILDVADPKKRFSVAEYKKLAEQALSEIYSRNRVPVICGGTGFYIEAVIDGVELPSAPPNPDLRMELNGKSAEELMIMLETIDPDRAHEIDPNNKRRVIRAIEIAQMLGKVPRISKKESVYDLIMIGLNAPVPELRKRISDRLHRRIKQGMIEEAKYLYAGGLSYEKMEELGLEYRYLAKYLKGELDLEHMIQKLNTEIWRYSRRQMTWFKRDSRVTWFSPDEDAKVMALIKKSLEKEKSSVTS